MSSRMREQSAETGRKLARLLELGFDVNIYRSKSAPMIVVRVARPGIHVPAMWYDGGTLDACVAQIDTECAA